MLRPGAGPIIWAVPELVHLVEGQCQITYPHMSWWDCQKSLLCIAAPTVTRWHVVSALWPTQWLISWKSPSSPGGSCNAFCYNGSGRPDQPPGNNWAAARACGRSLLEIARASWILGNSQLWNLAWQPSCQGSIIAQGVLEGTQCHQKAGVCCQGDWTAGQGLAQEAGHLANISSPDPTP